MPRPRRLAPLRTPLSAIHALELRRHATDPESLMWYRLRAQRFEGWKFRRQVPLGPYVVDFLCVEASLVVELDGGQHADRVAYDDDRSRWLRQKGFRVVRYWNNDVMGNLEAVLEHLLGELEKARPSPPAPPPEGEGRN